MCRIILIILLIISFSSTAQMRTYCTEEQKLVLPDTASQIAIEVHAALRKNDLKNKWWGVAWDRTAPDCYKYIALKFGNSGYDELHDSRYMDVIVGRRKGQQDITIATKRIKRNVDLYNGTNRLAIEWQADSATILVGKSNLKPIIRVPLTCPTDTASIIGEGDLNVNLMVVEHTPLAKAKAPICISEQQLNAHFASSSDPKEGYWVYLDRNTDDNRARLGGMYRIALVRSGYDYKIYYISGAEVNPDAWQSGMLKGELTATIFSNQFDAVWYDSLFEPISREVHARFDDSSVLTIEFPLYGSQIRFSKAFMRP